MTTATTTTPAPPPRWPALLVWAVAAAALQALDGQLDLANLALLLVLAATLAALWLPTWAALAGGVLAVMAFNWALVPPRHSLAVDLHQHALLLAAMLGLNLLVAGLMASLRHQASQARLAAARAEQLRRWGDTLRASQEAQAQAGALQAALQHAAGVPVALVVLRTDLPAANDDAALLRLEPPGPPTPGTTDRGDDRPTAGPTDADQRAGLWLCLRGGHALGPGTGRHGEQPDLYLPLRSAGPACGAALLFGPPPAVLNDTELRAHLQALCDLCGDALARGQAARAQARAEVAAETAAVRAALLAAISHDYRTPLATILGAASALQDQGERLDAVQRLRHARSIVEEAGRLARLTDNTLQLARLDAPGVQLRCDWESPEEIVGVALRHARRRPAGQRVRARLEPGLPLLWCDATLVSQLLDNLIDNALKYSPDDAPVELLLRRQGERLLLAVRDRGPGIAPAWRERVFEVFHRGAEAMAGGITQPINRNDAQGRSGSGVGLTVCRAIVRAHGGELGLRARSHGGCSFEAALPLREPPAQPGDEAQPAPCDARSGASADANADTDVDATATPFTSTASSAP